MRLFIAVTLCKSEKERLQRGIELLRTEAESGSYTREENLHITVVFLGEVPQQRIADLCAVMQDVRCVPFRIATGKAGVFHRDDGDICWLGIRKNLAFDSLYRQLCSALGSREFDVPERDYRPHVTLGRRMWIKSGETLRRVEETVGTLSIAVDRITLMESKRIAGRLVYEPVYERCFER